MSDLAIHDRPDTGLDEVIPRVALAERRRRVARRDRWATVLSILVIAALVAGWSVSSGLRLVSPLFLPAPWRVAHQAMVIAQHGYAGATLWQHAAASTLRVILGFAIAAGLAIPIGLGMGINRFVKAVVSPVLEFYWPLPPLAYLPLVIIWLGIDEASKLVLLTAAMFGPICMAAQAGVRSVPVERIHAAQSLGGSRRQVFFHIVLPSALPEIFTGLRIAVGVGWGTLVAAELVAATRGIGFMILSASNFLATDIVFIGIAAIAVCAIGSSLAVRAMERLLVPWKGRS
jgi:taurine transport system permease protein